ncbi:cellobiose phosphorylase [Bartonella callosciuri]|uniref:Cellobiose phosphorylase n=1 Tax=Bartonella callosciuri TaxID=686223 RepID=A0A840NPQ1_9HYPH|nr:cellobiose phosphorylase [Bartonella callosciuri]
MVFLSASQIPTSTITDRIEFIGVTGTVTYPQAICKAGALLKIQLKQDVILVQHSPMILIFNQRK